MRAFPTEPLSGRSLDAFEARTLDRPDLGNYRKTNSLAASWPLTRWDLPSLTLAAFFYHPDLDVALAQFDVSKGENRHAGERANPSLTLAPGYNSSRPAGAVSYWIADVALTLPVETAGKRGYRIDQARQLSEAARLMIAQTAWQIRREVRASLLELYSALENEAQARRLQALQAEAVSLLLAQAALHLELAKQVPDVELGPAYQYDQGENKWALGFTATLPVFNRNQGAIAAAEARRVRCRGSTW